jgi:hypothetical protein
MTRGLRWRLVGNVRAFPRVSKFEPERDGWTLREAVMHTELPDLLAGVRSCMEELRARRVLFDAPGWWAENLAPPARNETWAEHSDQELLDVVLRSLLAAVETMFRNRLYDGTLVCWGRPGSSLAEYKKAPAWAVTQIESWWKGGGILRLESGEMFYAARGEPTNASERRFSVSELRVWLREHHTKRRASGNEPTDRDDCEAAKRKFPGVSRDVVRAERREILAPDLLRPGRRPPMRK